MKPVRTALLAIGCLSLPLAPLSAGEVGLLGSKLFGTAQVVAGQGKYDDVSPTALGVRVGWSLVDLKAVEFSMNATYQPRAEGDLKLDGTPVGRYGVEYAALGAQLDFKVLVNLNAGLELRQERLTSDISGSRSDTTQTRPWIRAGVGFNLPIPVLSPFARLEVAVPATKETRTGTSDELRKSLAPQFQVGIYAGIRF